MLADRAVLFVDGRYTLQARSQVDGAIFEIAHLVETPPDQWIEKNLPAGARLGYDPWLHTAEGAEKLAKACSAVGATLVPLPSNPVDAIWRDRPAPPLGKIVLHDPRFAGEESGAKLERIRAELAKLRADALVVSDPHAVAWTFNIRGADVSHTPLPLAFALIRKEGRPALYVDARKLDNKVRDSLERIADVCAPDDLTRDVVELGARHLTVRFDQASAADALVRLVERRGRQACARPRSHRTAEGGQEPDRDRRRARRASRATARPWRASSPGSTAKRSPAD